MAQMTPRRRISHMLAAFFAPLAIGIFLGLLGIRVGGLWLPASLVAWQVWMNSWIAAHWTPADLPGLRQLIRLYDQVERGKYVRMGELRLWSDTFGLTPKGRQDRRWLPRSEQEATKARPSLDRHAHLRVTH